MAAKHVISVAVLADTSGFGRGLNQMANDGGWSKMTKQLKNVGLAVGVGFGVNKLVDFGKAALTMGSDLNETLNKSNTVFGDSAKKIEEWANGAASSFGQSKQEALDAASTFGNMFVQLGTGTDEAAAMSQQMTELASDFASFHNAAPTDVIDAMSAAFRGEYDAVQKFVPTITAAAVEQKALAMTGKKTTKELTAQEKALATQTLLLEGAGDAMGDYDRTSDSAANKQRELSAKWKDAQATLGQKLLPALAALTDLFVKILDNKPALIGLLVALAAAFATWAVSAAAAAVATWAAVAPVIAAAAPFILLGALVAALAVIVVKNWDTIKRWTLTVFKAVKDAIAGAFNWVKTNWPLLLAIITGPIGLAALAISKNWQKIKDGATAAKDWIVRTFNTLVSFITGLPGRVSSAASGLFDGIKNAFRSAINWVIDKWNGLSFTLPSFSAFGKTIGGNTLSTPNIPRLAAGGLVSGSPWGTLANIGEGGWGRDEIVSPVDLMRRIVREEAGGDTNININVAAGVGDPVAIGREVKKVLTAYERSGGRR